jgi:hypothetical protein
MAAVSTAMLAGCSPGGEEHARTKVCVDRTFTRVDDRICDDEDRRHGHGFAPFHAWYYIPAGRTPPAVGGTPAGGSLAPSEPASSYSRAPATAEGISRGGFGSSAAHAGGDAGGAGGHAGGGE